MPYGKSAAGSGERSPVVAALVIDNTAVPKKGEDWVGVAAHMHRVSAKP